MKYRVILADPPWNYKNVATRAAASKHYRTMSLYDIMRLNVRKISMENSCLFLWTTNVFLRPAFTVMEVWGFEYKTCITWIKPSFGLGNYFRSATEHCLFGIRGKIRPKLRNIPTWFKAPRKGHSVKPQRIYEIIESCFDPPYLELFARTRREGWDVWGDEVKSSLQLERISEHELLKFLRRTESEYLKRWIKDGV